MFEWVLIINRFWFLTILVINNIVHGMAFLLFSVQILKISKIDKNQNIAHGIQTSAVSSKQTVKSGIDCVFHDRSQSYRQRIKSFVLTLIKITWD